jgi:hypothetical protein
LPISYHEDRTRTVQNLVRPHPCGGSGEASSHPLQAGRKEPDVPKGGSWKNQTISADEALRRLEEGRNVGIVGTKDTFAIFDIERENVPYANEYIPPPFRDTLIVRTRSGGLHL